MDAKEYLKSKHPSAVNPLDYLPINVMTVVGLMESYHQSKLAEMPSEKWLINFAYWIIDNVRTNDIVPWKVSEYLKQHLTESKQEEVKKNVGTDIPKDIDDTFGTLDNPDVF